MADEKVGTIKPLKEYRTILISGGINDALAREVVVNLLELNANSKDEITLIVNSEGGSVESAFMITDVMEIIQSPIRTIGLGAVMSAGLIIFMTGTKGKRCITLNIQFLSHRFWAGTVGDHEDLVSYSSYVDRTHDNIVRHYIKHTGLSKDLILKDLLNESNMWLSPRQAMKYKLADKFLRTKI